MSLGQLAGRVGRTAASVRRWERDESVPSDEVRERLAEVLGLSAAELHRLAEGTTPTVPPSSAPSEPPPRAEADPPTPSSGTSAGIPAAAPTSAPGTSAPTGPGRLGELWRRLENLEEPWLSYLRATLTLVGLLGLLVVLLWALGELSAALGEFLRGFTAPEPAEAFAFLID